jgi:hypothetical protein
VNQLVNKKALIIHGGSNMTGTDFFKKTLITKVAQLLRSADYLQKNQSRSYLNHLVQCQLPKSAKLEFTDISKNVHLKGMAHVPTGITRVCLLLYNPTSVPST